jgi:hypothetical protein
MKQSLEKLVGDRAVSAAGVDSAQVADLAEGASETEIEAGARTRTTKTQIVIFTTPKVGVAPASAVENEVDEALDQAADPVEADAPINPATVRSQHNMKAAFFLFTAYSLLRRATRRVNS